MNRQQKIDMMWEEFSKKEGVKFIFLPVLRMNLDPLLEKLLHDEFVRGYERGKSDERDAKEIDLSLKEPQ